MKGYINNYEDLQDWVKNTKQTAWNLYSGWPEKFSATHFLAKCEDESEAETSWELLKRMLEINASNGGNFTVYIPQPGNRGFSTRVQIPANNPAAANAGVAGIGNPYAIGMIPAVEHERRMREFEEKMRLERRIEDLESQQGSSVGAVGKILDKITEELDINNVFNALVAVFGPKLNPNMQPMQLAGTPVAADPGEHADGSGYNYDDPRLLVFLDTVRCKFGTDEEFYTFLGRVGAFFDKNPQMAISFLAGQN
jgi:hypothetical protein